MCATGFQWVEAREAAKYLTMGRTAPHTQSDPAQNNNNPKAEKPDIEVIKKT